MVLSTLTPTGRRAERFAAVLDGAAPADTSLGELAAVAHALGSLPLQRVAPDAEFRDALRTRLVAVATVRPPGTPEEVGPARPQRTGRWHGQRAMAVATGAFATVVAVAGVGIAASRSLPGDPFYGVKRDVQAAQLFVTSGAYARGQEQLGFASDRLNEIAQLLGTPTGLGPVVAGEPTAGASDVSVPELRQVLDDMDAETLAGSRDLTAAFADAHQRAALLALRSFASRQYDRLHALLPDFPPVLQPRVDRSLALLSSIRTRADALLADGACGTGCAGAHTDRLGAVPAPSHQSHATQPGTTAPQGSTSGGGSATTAPPAGSSTQPANGNILPSQPGTGSGSGGLQSLLGGLVSPAPSPSAAPPTLPTTEPTPLGGLSSALLPSPLSTNPLSSSTSTSTSSTTTSSSTSSTLLPLPNLSPLTSALLP